MNHKKGMRRKMINESRMSIPNKIGKKDKEEDFFELVSHFLRRRNTIHSKFVKSDLEKVMISLINLPASQWLT
jgi:hypothetical protein